MDDSAVAQLIAVSCGLPRPTVQRVVLGQGCHVGDVAISPSGGLVVAMAAGGRLPLTAPGGHLEILATHPLWLWIDHPGADALRAATYGCDAILSARVNSAVGHFWLLRPLSTGRWQPDRSGGVPNCCRARALDFHPGSGTEYAWGARWGPSGLAELVNCSSCEVPSKPDRHGAWVA